MATSHLGFYLSDGSDAKAARTAGKDRGMCRTAAFGLIAVCLWGSVALGGGAYPYVDPSQEFVVSAIAGQAQYHPRLWGDVVAWHVGVGGDVYAKVLSSGEVIPISVGQGGSDYVNIHGKTVVWGEWAGGSPVWAYDLFARSKTQVTSSGESPDVFGDSVVWERNHSIIVKDIQNGSETTIPGTGTLDQKPAIFGEVVVWTDDGVIRGHDLADGVALTISTTDRASWTPPDINGNVVAWRDTRNGNLDIYAADISDPENISEFPVCTDSAEQGAPAVYEGVIVWTDYRNGDMDVYGYDTTSGTEFPIAIGSGNQFAPSIYKDMIVWSNEIGTEVSIHGNTIVPEPACATLLAIGLSGLPWRRRRR